MPGVFLLAPGPVFHDPNQQNVHSNATVTASGSSILQGYGAPEVSLFINVTASPTGTSPTLQFTIQEVDPGDNATVIGTIATSTVITAIGIQRITLPSTFGGNIKVSWTVTGAGASFTQVYSSLVAKVGSSMLVDSTGVAISSSNPQVVSGSLTNNAGAPGANNFGVLPAVSTAAAPTYVEGRQVALSTDLAGALRVTGSVTATNASIGVNNAAAPASSTQIGGFDGTNLQSAKVFDLDTGAGTDWNLGISWRLPASGGSVVGGTGTDPIRIDPTGTTTQPISAASLPLPTGAATETTLASRLADSTFTGRINTLGQKAMAASTPIVIASDQSTLNVQGDKTNNAAAPGATNLGTLPALANAAAPSWTEGNQVVASVTLAGDLRSISKISDGTNTAAVKAASTAPVAADPALVVVISPNQAAVLFKQTSSTATTSSVASSATNVTLLAANANRLGCTVYNDSVKILYLKLGATATTSDYTTQLDNNAYYEVPFGYTGRIDGIWAAVNGNARVTELT